MDDGSKPPANKYFEDCSYNEASRTFIGVIRWSEVTFGGDSRWEYRLVFSEDFQTIESGEVRSFDDQDNLRDTCDYPYDLNYKLAEP